MRKILVIGMGEVGAAHLHLLAQVPSLELKAIDLKPEQVPEKFRMNDKPYQPDLMLVAMRHGPDFLKDVTAYIEKYRPGLINVLSTVPPGTCAKLGPLTTHSTTRGLHPHLEEGLLAIVKHVGGPYADRVAQIFSRAGIKCYVHELAKTTEAAHILNNVAYGVNLMLADEMQAVCREWGVDYFEAVMVYTASNNAGYRALDQNTKSRMILTPPNGKIGGHCVRQSAALIEKRPPMIERLVSYGD